MKIAITQREIVHNNITYDCFEQNWYSLLSHCDIDPIPNASNTETDFDMLILSGGDTTPNRTQTELMYYNIALLKGVPILGVCHGAFFINEFHGGVNEPIEGHHNTAHQVLIEDTVEFVNSYHTNSIATLGTDLKSIAVCTHDNTVEAFKHKDLPIWGLVWHPERTQGLIPSDLAEVLYGKS